MPNITLSVPQDIYDIVKSHREIRWSEIARRAIVNYAKKLSLLDAILSDSELTEEDVEKLDEKIKGDIQKYYMKLLKNDAGNRHK